MKALLTLLWLERRDCPLSRPVPSPQANGLHYEGRAGQGRLPKCQGEAWAGRETTRAEAGVGAGGLSE